ncbi:hypothetical protein ACBP95_09250 [Morganella morganii]|uniref:hypothetical protein n=1 Tax=Morganella morganii TaxID=582 RepID=UPI003526A4D7
MPSIQGAQTHQVPAHMNNDLRSTNGAVSQSSYVSSSGIKSVLLNAWNTVKSAVSGMLSSFGLHISGEQGSDKPGREIVMDISSRPLPQIPLPGMDEQFCKTIYGSNNNEDTYSEIDENESSEVFYLKNNLYKDLNTYRVVSGETGTAEADDPANHTYEDPEAYRVVSGETGTAEADNPEDHTYEDPEDYRVVSGETGTAEAGDPEDHTYEDPDVYRDTDNVIDSGNMVLVCDDTYAVPRDSLDAGSNAKSEEPGYESLHENNYAVPYKPGNTVSIPDNDRKHSLSDAQLQQRIMRERLNIS